MKLTLSDDRGFWGLLGLLLAAGISLFLFYLMAKGYFAATVHPVTGEERPVSASGQTISSSSPKSALDSATRQIHAAEQKELQREQDVFGGAR